MSRGIAIRIMILAEAVAMGIGMGGLVSVWNNPDMFWFGCICVLAVLFVTLMAIATFELLAADEKRKRRDNGLEAH